MRRLTSVGTVLALGIAVHSVLNLARVRRPEPAVPPVDEQVSVLIPARNEEAAIVAAVTSALAQQGVPNLEVLVLDDASTDRTAALLEGITDTRLRVITSQEEPPVDWLGKPWACARLASAATGEVLVFIDADVELREDAVRASVRALRAHDFALISPYPRQEAVHWIARLTQPLVTWSWCALLPLQWAESSPRPSLAAANGQFLVIDAQAYRAVGGHQCVAGEVLEDVALMRSFKRSGHATCTMDGSALAVCTMYETAGELTEGYAKSLWHAFGGVAGTVCVNAVLVTAFIMPPLAVLASRSRRTRGIGLVGYLAAVGSRAMVARMVGTRTWPDSAAHPISIGAFVVLNAISWSRHVQRSNSWKGRPLR